MEEDADGGGGIGGGGGDGHSAKKSGGFKFIVLILTIAFTPLNTAAFSSNTNNATKNYM